MMILLFVYVIAVECLFFNKIYVIMKMKLKIDTVVNGFGAQYSLFKIKTCLFCF